jgi:hypothetical protein
MIINLEILGDKNEPYSEYSFRSSGCKYPGGLKMGGGNNPPFHTGIQ